MKFLIALICMMGGTLFAQTTQPSKTTKNATSQPALKKAPQVEAPATKSNAEDLLRQKFVKEAEEKEIEKQRLDKLGISMSDKNKLGGLKVGEEAPNFSGVDQNGKKVDLKEMLKEGEVVVIFYRGYWCGICNKHLSAMESKLSSITDKGANVIAVSTESNEFTKKTSEENKLSFSVISDTNNSILSDYKVLYEVSDSYQQKIKKYTKSSIKEFNDSEEAILPIPATYIIDQAGNVSWVDYNINYRERASIEDISKALK